MGNICIIGPRSSGKTTYLAGLAYWPDKKRTSKKSSLFKVEAIGDAKELVTKAEDIICEGASLPPTDILGGIHEAPLYQFQIQIKTPITRLLKKPDEINLVVRDYPGEVFDDLASGTSNPLHEEFLDECLVPDMDGCLLLLSEWTPGTDKFYSKVIEKFIELMDRQSRIDNFRLAVAMSKCERGELWPGRLDPETDIFELYLPRTRNLLRDSIPKNNLQFYATSTFGVLRRNDPRPNRIDRPGKNGRHAVLRQAKYWRPYAMIAPLYWLSQGRRMRADA